MISNGKKIIINETELIEVLNNDYIIINESSSGKKTWHVIHDNNTENNRIAIQVIKKHFEEYPNITHIEEHFQQSINFLSVYNSWRSWKTAQRIRY